MKNFLFKKISLIPIILVIFYLITHLFNLTLLPVFADESIYIRWSQLIIDDADRYLFFPLNDGKTPLQMWLMVPLQLIFGDPLFAGRVLSVLIGLLQMLVMGYLTKILGGKNKTAYLSMLLTAILPFWYFHHRMALTDGLMALNVSLALAAAIVIVKDHKDRKAKPSIKQIRFLPVVILGLAFGAALWTKIPAILLAPSLLLTIFLSPKKWPQTLSTFLQLVLGLGLGLMLFLLLKLNPAFGQLFARGGDFLYPLSDILAGGYLTTIRNIPNYLLYFFSYLTFPVVLLTLYALFSPTMKRPQWFLFLSFLSYFLPIAMMGKVVYPRYFLPIAIFLTLSATLAIQEIVQLYVFKQKQLIVKTMVAAIITFALSSIITKSMIFVFYSLTDSNLTPFVMADKTQYLTEWSSGHGIKEAVALIQAQAKTQSVAVATEGYFGTLPDGVLMYLHRQDVSNIYVEGIGQPVLTISDVFKDRAKDFDQIYLVVNSHRMGIPLDQTKLLAQYCRPFQAPCLQIWDISELVK